MLHWNTECYIIHCNYKIIFHVCPRNEEIKEYARHHITQKLNREQCCNLTHRGFCYNKNLHK